MKIVARLMRIGFLALVVAMAGIAAIRMTQAVALLVAANPLLGWAVGAALIGGAILIMRWGAVRPAQQPR
ncbi:hypothetical protein [Sulfobacillus harzensis]|uniref:Uncharacterized protein n=1 Tax=Sulfobacillus harzensis TaxID=2729629 RepID=A0A7Y0L7M8_9FIRM|nr:hypothetical protein [Sulfobacillus harzensis]NMP24472.1 hypothetical protein [Sulfobacillus harzensis]